jgi:hypothetical protein
VGGRLDTAFFNQVCGYTPARPTRYTGMNAVSAPDAQHIYRGSTPRRPMNADRGRRNEPVDHRQDGGRAPSSAASTTATGPVIRPINVDGDDRYVVVLHTKQVTQLRTNTSTGQWLDIQKAAMTGDGSAKNPIMTGALGMYNGAVLHESTRITNGVNSATGAPSPPPAAVLLGAQAAAIGFGQGQSFENFDWNEELFDYGNQLGVEAGLIFGLKKLRFNS